MRWFLFTMVLANIASHMHMALMPLYLRELGASVGQGGVGVEAAGLAPSGAVWGAPQPLTRNSSAGSNRAVHSS